MDPLAEQVELLAAAGRVDHDLPVEHVAPGREAQLREVAGQRLAVARLEDDVVAVDERHRPEAVVFRLVRVPVALRQAGRRFGELGGDRRAQRQSHRSAD